MVATEKYQKAKIELGYSKAWFRMIGDRFNGGGGGIGSVVNLYLSQVQIYHQKYDGAKNYHDLPAPLKPYLEKVLITEIPSLIERAIELQSKALEKLADEAVRELRAATIDAGLSFDLGELKLFKDGDKWCAVVREGFTNIQECNAGFGDTPKEAVKELGFDYEKVNGK